MSLGFISCTKEEPIEISSQSVSRSFVCGDEGRTFDVSIKSKINVDLENPYEWITITKTKEGEEQIFHFTVLKNETAFLRQAGIVFSKVESSKTLSISISILQFGKSEE